MKDGHSSPGNLLAQAGSDCNRAAVGTPPDYYYNKDSVGNRIVVANYSVDNPD